MITVNARNLSLEEVHRLFGYQRQFGGQFTDFLNLEPISSQDRQELIRVREDFEPYLNSKPSEGIVKAMTVFPLLRLAGYYSPPIRLRIEEGIDEIRIDTEDTKVTGRFDMVAVNRAQRSITETPFWILVIETKEGFANAWAGLPQLLTYAHQSLENQQSVWGLVSTGLNYQFVHITASKQPVYQLMPLLNLFESADLDQLLQVLKAICQSRLVE
jgi:hypothetical protein